MQQAIDGQAQSSATLGFPILNTPAVPTPINWMDRPQPLPGVLPGLEYLLQIDKIFVQQFIGIYEALNIGYDQPNNYAIKNIAGQQIFWATENSNVTQMCWGNLRGFEIKIIDSSNKEIFKVQRDFKCCSGWCWCAGCCDNCSQGIVVKTPNDEIMGYVNQKSSFIDPMFQIYDKNHKEVFTIEGPCCSVNGPCQQDFNIYDAKSGLAVGKLLKQYGGYIQETFTNADNFVIEFPENLALEQKAVFIGTLFLIDFMFYEERHDRKRRNVHQHRY